MTDAALFYLKASELIEILNDFGTQHNLSTVAAADHIGFRCDSRELFEQMRATVEPESDFMYQSYISKRRIAIFKLQKPFETVLGTISFLELNDQKPDNSQVAGFDHIEIYPLDSDYDALVTILKEKGVTLNKVERPHHTTYDIALGDGYTLKLTREKLIEKIKRDEMF